MRKKTKKKSVTESVMPLFDYAYEEESAAGGLEESKWDDGEQENGPTQPLSVSGFLDATNAKLAGMNYRVQGEIGRVQPRGTYYFFALKDSGDESTLNCFSWARVISVCGVSITEGLEVIVAGHLEVYKRTGSLSFQVETIEIVGEGALKKAYEELKIRLEEEGLFAAEIKKPIPQFAKNIALVTSRHGEAINDFTTNIGRFGFAIKFKDSRVEGQRAVFDIIRSIEIFNRKPECFDVLVLIRGGGSWESLQAFNNEAVARAIRDSRIPVICGIGHEGDVTIADLVADYRASTPTGAAKKISEHWAETAERVRVMEKTILDGYAAGLTARRMSLEGCSSIVREYFSRITSRWEEVKESVRRSADKLGFEIEARKRAVADLSKTLPGMFSAEIVRGRDLLRRLGIIIEAGDPARQLRLGYSILTKQGRVMKDATDLKSGDAVRIMLNKGAADAEIKEVYLEERKIGSESRTNGKETEEAENSRNLGRSRQVN